VKKADPKALALTAEQRLLLLDTWQRSGLPAADFAALVGLSRYTLYEWKRRFDAEGPAGLMDRPKGAPPASAASRSSAPRRRSSRSSAGSAGSAGAGAAGGRDGSGRGEGSPGFGDGKCSDMGPPVVGHAHRLGGGYSFTPLNLQTDSHFGKWHKDDLALPNNG
ncbi:MAG TPA: helix-turn-helix domain-containing protein, partial [Gemmataceae bacterium]|nr:helix-turn-helix domain-containing protein [Gemmataceae bacterium]